MVLHLIVALDFADQREALKLVDQLDPKLCALKVGSEMFTRFGSPFVQILIEKNFKVFLDLKFHDIPNTVAKACKSAADLGVWMLNIHASGGFKMMEAAAKALHDCGKNRPLLIAVTVLTSLSEAELQPVGISIPLIEQVKNLALLAQEAGLDGVVCSANEAHIIKDNCGNDFLTITPGIRLEQDNKDDQCRIMTPREAIIAGSDYLVIGRSITQAPDPMQVINSIITIV